MRYTYCFIFSVILNFLFCISIYSQWTGNTFEQPLVIPGATEVFDLFPRNVPFAIEDGNGGAVVVGFAYSSGRYFLVIQRIDDEGYVKWTDPGKALLVTSKKPEDQTAFPVLHPDGHGGVYLAYSYETFLEMIDGFLFFEDDVYLQHFNAEGQKQWSGRGLAISTLKGYQIPRFIVDDGDDGIILFYEDYRDTTSAIYAQRISPQGQILWEQDGKLITNLYMDLIHPDGQGGAYIYPRFQEWGGQYITSDGELLWNEEAIRSGIGIRFGGIVDGSNGNVIIAGTPEAADTLLAQKMSPAGVPLWGEKGIRWSHPNIQYRVSPKVTSDGRGGVLFFWRQYMQHIDSDGLIIYDDPKLVIHNPNLPYIIQNVIFNKLHGAVVCIQDHSNQGAIYIQKILPEGEQPWGYNGIRITDSSCGSVDPNLIFDNNGNTIVIFEKLSPNSGIYAQKVDYNGDIVTSVSAENFHTTQHPFQIEAYPNPFNSYVIFHVSCSPQYLDKTVHLDIYDVLGRQVVSMRKEVNASKEIKIKWDGTDKNNIKISSGVYVVVLKVGDLKAITKVVHIK